MKLTHKGIAFRDVLVTKNIVDILTDDEKGTSVYFPKQGGVISDLIGLNNVLGEEVKNYGNGIFERGLVNPGRPKVLYSIDSDKKIITIAPDKINIFYDHDKILWENEYIWHGTFDEALNEFREAGYRFVERL